MKKIAFIFLFAMIANVVYSQSTQQHIIPDTIFNKYVVPCGLSPENILKLDVANGNIQFRTLPINFEAAAIIPCGRFDIYYEDLLSTTPNGGFSDPTEGLNRRNTLCAVLTYVQSVFDFSNIPLNAPIKLHVNQSFAPTVNPAPSTATFLAFAGPTYINTGTPSIINGFISDYVNTGIDPATSNQYHASLTVNFDQTFNPNPTPINWHNDYTAPIQNCQYDLYSVLLHEIGHTLGWLSYTHNNSTTGFPESILGNNQFSALDNTLHKGTVLPLNLNPLIVGAPSSPSINPIYATNTTALTNNDIWINPLAAPDNDPVYSGLLLTFWPTSFSINSILSHLDDQMLMYSIRARISPGDNKDYVMGPFGIQGILRRTFENIEINTFLNLGYAINPSFPNIAIVPNSLPYSTRMASYPNYLDNLFPETMAADFTLVNNIGSSIVINLSTDPTIVDNDGDPVSVLPSSLVNIRGCGNGGNNHNQLVLSSANQVITYTPRPNFYGRAQFGFKLFDGKDEGSYVIYTIDVLRGTNVSCTPGSNLILNGNLEEGSEVKQLGANEVIDASVNEQTYLREGKLRLGIHFGDSHPGNYLSNNWYPTGSGDMIRESLIFCNGTQYKSRAGGTNTTLPTPTSNIPKPLPVGNIGDRYRELAGNFNYFNLCSDMQTCTRYVLEFDYFAQPFHFANGTIIPLTIGFVNTPAFTTPLNYTFSKVENITIINNSWQHITLPFTYCGTTPASILNLVRPVTTLGILLDNLVLREELTLPPPLTVNISPINPSICVGDNITLSSTVNDALCNVTYLWSPGGATTSTINVAPSSTTTYSLTVDDGCRSTSVNNTVTVNPLPTISITPSSPTICEGQSVQLTASGANTYVWSPATGLSSTTGAIVTATPTTTTTYTVTGTDVNGCTATSSVTITVIPVAYTHPNGITITTNTTWTGVNFKINGPVYIQDNVTLTIQAGSVIEFGPEGIIRNDQFSTGGLRNISNTLVLVLNDGVLLTGLAGCSDNFWKGIDITGEVEIINSTIENALTGINLHDVFDLGNNTFLVSGRLNVSGATFRNNQRAIVMNSSLNSNPIGSLVVSFSNFENTTAIPSSFINQITYITVSSNSLFSIQNTSFNNNNAVFSGINRPIGINYFSPSIGGGTYLIENNTFTDLQEAIIVRNSRVMQIKTNTFMGTDRAILLQSGRLDLVENNNFTVPNATNNDNYGVRLIGTSGADIINNFFTGTSGSLFGVESYGIIAENTGTGGSTVFDNTFEGTDIGIQTQGDNSNLKIRCNTFAADGNPHNIASWTTLIIPGPLGAMNTLRRQGSSCFPTNLPNENENQAGNEWLDNCGVGLTDVFVDINISFPYYAHEENAIGGFSTQPTCSTPFWATNSLSNVDLDVCLGVNKTNTSCNNQFAGLIKDPDIDFEGYVVEVRNLMLLLQQQADSLTEILAEGNAPTLFNAIGTLSSGDLKNLLLAASPYLSDEVLIAYIFSSPPAGNLQQVIVANSPVSERVQQVLDGTVLPNGIMNNINNAQTGTSERTIVEQEISYLKGEVQLLANDLERRFSQNADRPREKQLLIDLNDVEAQKRLSEVLLGEENTIDSKVIIDAMLQDTAVSSVDENLHFCNLMTCLINATDQNRTLQQLTPSEMQTIVTVAFSPTQVAEKAQGVLTALAQQNFVHPIAKIPTGNNLRETSSNNTGLKNSTSINVISLYPNPNTEGILEFKMTNDIAINELQITVYNVVGKQVINTILTPKMDIRMLNNGVYIVVITNDKGLIVTTEKLIIQK